MKTVLIATIGTTPAVLTETVWALAVNGKKCLKEAVVPDYVRVFTYAKCVDSIRETLLVKGANGLSGWENLKEHLRRRKIKIEGKLGFGEGNIIPYSKNDGTYVQDAFDDGAMGTIADTFVREIKSLRDNNSEDVRIIASISGGRKTDGALLMSCMGLLGQAGDRIVHLIPSIRDRNDFQALNFSSPRFLFPEHGVTYTCVNADYKERCFSDVSFGDNDVGLNLFEIPLLMMDRRDEINLSGDHIVSYSDLIREQQASLTSEGSSCQKAALRFDFAEGNILVNDVNIDSNSCRGRINHSVFLSILCEAFPPECRSRGEFCHSFFLKAHEAYDNSQVELPSWLTRMVKNTKRGPFHGNMRLAEAYSKQLSLARDLFKRHSLTKHFVCGTEFKIDWERNIENYEDVKLKFSDLQISIGLKAPF